MPISAHVFSVLNLGIALGIAFHSCLRLAAVRAHRKNFSLKLTTGVLILQVLYCVLFINTRGKIAAGESDRTITNIENVAPLIYCFIFAPISWLLLIRAKSLFVSNSNIVRYLYYAGNVFIVVMFLLRIVRVILRFVYTDMTDKVMVASLTTVAVQLNNIANIPVSIFQVVMEGIFLYQFGLGLRGGKSLKDIKLTTKSTTMLISVTVEFLIAIIIVIVSIISYFIASDPVFNFMTAILASIQIANLVEFGTEIGSYLEDLRSSNMGSSDHTNSAGVKSTMLKTTRSVFGQNSHVQVKTGTLSTG